MAFFALSTNLHENHLYAVVLLCCFALGAGRWIWILLGVFSLTFLANMVLFDPAVTGPLSRAVGRPLPVRGLSMLVAAVNVLAFGVLLLRFRRHTLPAGATGAPQSG